MTDQPPPSTTSNTATQTPIANWAKIAANRLCTLNGEIGMAVTDSVRSIFATDEQANKSSWSFSNFSSHLPWATSKADSSQQAKTEQREASVVDHLAGLPVILGISYLLLNGVLPNVSFNVPAPTVLNAAGVPGADLWSGASFTVGAPATLRR